MITYPTADELRGAAGPNRRRAAADRLAERYTVEPNGCWRWTRARTTTGYGHFSIRSVYYQAHRLMYILHRGPVTTPALDHLCRNRWCVNPWHLEPVSRAENVRRGSKARLTPDTVRAIRAAVGAGASQRAVARLFHVDHSTVCRVIRGNRWADVPDEREVAA